jgi:hypothetical protein
MMMCFPQNVVRSCYEVMGPFWIDTCKVCGCLSGDCVVIDLVRPKGDAASRQTLE